MGEFWYRAFKVLIVFAHVSVIATCVILTMPKVRRARGLCAERDQIRQRIEEKSREIAQYRDKQCRFTTDREFVESLARENRCIFPNELVFVFDD